MAFLASWCLLGALILSLSLPAHASGPACGVEGRLPFSLSPPHPLTPTGGRGEGEKGRKAKALDPQPPTASVEGRRRAVAIFAQFAGEGPADAAPPDYAARIFDSDLPGSLSHFYAAMSFGMLRVEGEALPKVHASDHDAASYPAGGFGLFVSEVLQRADEEVDFGRYDSDGPDGLPNSGDDDGYVDVVFVVLSSAPEGFFLGPATGMGRLGLDEDFATDDRAVGGGIIK